MRDEDRYLGCLLGLAVGDAIGTTVEFSRRGSFAPVTDMDRRRALRAPAGPVDRRHVDGALPRRRAWSIVGGFDPVDQMERYCAWQEQGYLSATGTCFDIGNTVAAALRRYRDTANPWSGSADPRSAGNGALMRLAPVPMYFAASFERAVHFAAESSRTTHAAPEALDSARLFGAQLRAALAGAPKEEILAGAGFAPSEPAVRAIAECAWAAKAEGDVRGTGYVVASLEAALWCFAHADSYGAAVLRAVNLGDDADTTAAICGQLAGAFYGVSAIPTPWREKLAMRDEIEDFAGQLLAYREA